MSTCITTTEYILLELDTDTRNTLFPSSQEQPRFDWNTQQVLCSLSKLSRGVGDMAIRPEPDIRDVISRWS
jgi:hypothetical protein